MKYLLFACLAGLGCGSLTLKNETATTAAPAKNGALSGFMEGSVNPPFSKLSFLLFHAQDDAAPELIGMLPDASRELVGVAASLAGWNNLPTYSAQAKQVFHEYAVALHQDATKLDLAVREDRINDARMAFDDLRRKCDSCHHFFRYEEPLAAPVDPRLRR